MVHLKGVGYVRAGSWPTKPITDRWRIARKQLKDASLLMVARLDHLLFEDASSYSQTKREIEEDTIIWELEDLRRQIDGVLAKFPKDRRAGALEQVAGRTPEEAAAYRAKARAIRKSM